MINITPENHKKKKKSPTAAVTAHKRDTRTRCMASLKHSSLSSTRKTFALLLLLSPSLALMLSPPTRKTNNWMQQVQARSLGAAESHPAKCGKSLSDVEIGERGYWMTGTSRSQLQHLI